MSHSDRVGELVDQLTAVFDDAVADGSIADLQPTTARRLVSVAARCWGAVGPCSEEPTGHDMTPTDAVMLATVALRSHDLNPFDLALWFSRSPS